MKRLLLLIVLSGFALCNYAQRSSFLLNTDWKFRFSHQVEKNTDISVTIPHTWNAQDALSGKLDYKRGIGNYERSIYVKPEWKNKRLFLRFGGVNTIADVFLNGKYLGEHRGGYAAFVFELTDKVKYGERNQIMVRVSNSERLDVMPLVGDFNFYGGIYRDVELLVTSQACISPLDYASPGVYLNQNKVDEQRADVSAVVLLSNCNKERKVKLVACVKDGKKLICQKEQNIHLGISKKDTRFSLPLTIEKPRLWDGKKDPFMYQVEVTLWENQTLLDKVIQPLGLRYYRVDPDKGFFLNGKHLPLKGVCRHQDRPEIGNALRLEHHEEDVRLMLEMGVNAVRLAHYQQAEDMYDLMDEHGIVTWAEIPFVGPGGYDDKGFVNSPAFCENGKEQLRELIRQNYNHPSICFWGLFNELKETGDNPVDYIKELNVLAHEEDRTRPTTAASNQDGDLNFITDCIAWNRYDGWYSNTPTDLAVFLDNMHKQNPNLCIGVSEYGAGASIYHQQDSLKRPLPTGTWHPENWQTYYHIENWKIIHERPFVWGSFVWNMFDFGAAHRHEGDRIGINDKGLVSFDRRVKKDAYYFYKANWNATPMIHLTQKRYTHRDVNRQCFMVFSNAGDVELFINGKSQGKITPDNYAIAVWNDVLLQKGSNYIEVRSVKNKLSDSMTIYIE